MLAVFDTNIVIDALNGVTEADTEYNRYERLVFRYPSQNRANADRIHSAHALMEKIFHRGWAERDCQNAGNHRH